MTIIFLIWFSGVVATLILGFIDNRINKGSLHLQIMLSTSLASWLGTLILSCVLISDLATKYYQTNIFKNIDMWYRGVK